LGNVKGTKKIVELVKGLSEDDLVICLVSGGGSALLCYPNIGFEKYLSSVNKHFSSGIDINRLNMIRKGLSNVKSGKLAKLTKAKIVSLIFSDVVGDSLSTIASGPTVGKGLGNVDNILLLNNTVALEGMRKKALLLGFKPVVLTNTLKGEAKLVGKNLIKKIINKKIPLNERSNKSLENKKIRKSNGIAYLFAGETTVTVRGKGKGGRCQELCLGAIPEISKLDDSVLICIGSDGIDGPTDTAGAVVDGKSLEKANRLGLDVNRALRENSSYAFFKKMDDLVFTGLTGSNVADIGVVIKL
jgi:glycerate-2-kinase